MEKAGLVKRTRDASDRRRCRIAITPLGEVVFHQASTEGAIVRRQAFDHLSNGDVEALGELLRGVRNKALVLNGIEPEAVDDLVREFAPQVPD
jgi:DNA-binding MarR family transcriptional regulator